MRPLPRFLALFFVAAIAASALADDTAYPIKLSQKFKAGLIVEIHATLEDTQSVTITSPQLPAPQMQEQSLKAELLARMEVLEVDGDGNSTSLKLTLKKLVDDKGAPLIEPGKVILVKRDDKESNVTLEGGGEISDAARKALRSIFPPNDKVGDDEVMGTKTPRKAGESWPINAELAAKDFAAHGVTIDPKDITGKVTLVGVETLRGSKALRIAGKVELKNAKPQLPPGVNLESCTIHAKFAGLIPTEEAQPRPETELGMDMDMNASGNGVKVESKAHRSLKLTMTPVTK